MRGVADQELAKLTTLSAEDLIPAEHPIRRNVVDEVLAGVRRQVRDTAREAQVRLTPDL